MTDPGNSRRLAAHAQRKGLRVPTYVLDSLRAAARLDAAGARTTGENALQT